MDKYIKFECIEKWILTESASLDGEEDRKYVVERLRAEIPAADVRPVVLGFNVSKDYPSLFECSVCGWSDDDTTTGDTQTYNYCPNCGADMREER